MDGVYDRPVGVDGGLLAAQADHHDASVSANGPDCRGGGGAETGKVDIHTGTEFFEFRYVGNDLFADCRT